MHSSAVVLNFFSIFLMATSVEMKINTNMNKLEKSVASIYVVDGDFSSSGIGFFVKNNLIASAAHLLPAHNLDAQEIVISLNDGSVLSPLEIWVDSARDVAFFRVKNKKLHSLYLTKTLKKVGTPVTAISNWGCILASRKGYIGAHVRAIPGIKTSSSLLFLLDLPVQPGNSGSPVLSRSGRVVAMVIAKYPDTLHGLAVAIPATDILKSMSQFKL